MSDFRDSCVVCLALDRALIGIVCCLIDHLVVEIHMDLIDAFWQQFRLELDERVIAGRSVRIARSVKTPLGDASTLAFRRSTLSLISISSDLEDASEMQL